MRLLVISVLLILSMGLLACRSEDKPVLEENDNLAVAGSPVVESAERSAIAMVKGEYVLAEGFGSGDAVAASPPGQVSTANTGPVAQAKSLKTGGLVNKTEAPQTPPDSAHPLGPMEMPASPAPLVSPADPQASSLTGPEIYDQIAPSIVFIETPMVDGGRHVTFFNDAIDQVVENPDYSYTGSGVLIEGGYIIAAYYAVWPYQAVRVVFPDGSEFLNVPVVNLDPLTGLAVLGPVEAPAPPLTLVNSEETVLGGEVFLIIYGEENIPFPKPVIGRGSLQAFRQPELSGITYYQTDISVSDGATNEVETNSTDTVSGGALVNSQGELIGISIPILPFQRSELTLAASATDIGPVISRLINGTLHPELNDRFPPLADGQFEFVFGKREDWDIKREEVAGAFHRRFLVSDPAGTVADIEVAGIGSYLEFTLQPFLGQEDSYQRHQRTVDESSHRAGSVELESEGPHILTISYIPNYQDGTPQFGEVRLQSNVRLMPLCDPDDGKTVSIGDVVVGKADFPGDTDWFKLELSEGETALITGESAASYSYGMSMSVDFPGSLETQRVSPEGEGGGVLADEGFSIVYRAPHTGDFFIEISAGAGYHLAVEKAPDDAEPVLVPPKARVEGEVAGPFGPMKVYKSEFGGFSIEVPAGWRSSFGDGRHSPWHEVYRAENRSNTAAQHWRQELVIVYDNKTLSELQENTGHSVTVQALRESANFFFLYWLGPNLKPDQFKSLGVGRTGQGASVELSAISSSYSKASTATFLLPDSLAFVGVAYTFPAELYDELKGLAEYSFSTFQVD